MDLLSSQYASSSEDDDNNPNETTRQKRDAPSSPSTPTSNPPPMGIRRVDKSALRAAPEPTHAATHALVIHNQQLQHSQQQQQQQHTPYNSTGTLTLQTNPQKSSLAFQPPQGPASLDPKTQNSQQQQRLKLNDGFDPITFDTQRKQFQKSGMALAPDVDGSQIKTNMHHHRRRYAGEKGPESIDGTSDGFLLQQAHKKSKLQQNENNKQNKRDEILVEGSDDEMQYGIWGPPTAAQVEFQADTTTQIAASGIDSLAPEQLAEREYLAEKAKLKGQAENLQDQEAERMDRMVERKMAHLLPPRLRGDHPVAVEPCTKFYGGQLVNYRGQSWTAPPAGVKPILAKSEEVQEGHLYNEEEEAQARMEHHACYVPKKCVGKLVLSLDQIKANPHLPKEDNTKKQQQQQQQGKGVHRIRLHPLTAHLLLSAHLDGSCHIWSLHPQNNNSNNNSRKLMRSYFGHAAAVRDVQFNHQGTHFLSASFDRFLRLWNVETGQVEQTLTNRRVPYVVQFYPPDNTFVLVGCSDHKIVTYDVTSGEIVQEYNHHLGPVNSITFCESAKKFVTTSDDKKVLVWEWDISVPIKYISSPDMHSIPQVFKHASAKFLIGQSMDNALVVYQASDRFGLVRKKRFGGHQVAGYACEVCGSGDGRFVCSGDGEGRVFFWDWKRQRILQKYRAHDNGPAIGCVWHPLEPSTVLTCGWDGVIKVWQ